MSRINAFAMIAGALVAGFLGGQVNTLVMTGFGVKPKAQAPTIIHTGPALSDSKASKIARSQWPELEQHKVDALTAGLTKIEKRKIVIFCAQKTDCGDLALDLENAFESARWTVTVEQPVMDDTVGIAATDDRLGAVLASATGLPVKVIKPNTGEHSSIVIGRKPR